MTDLDMLYDYYKDNNLAAGGYATLSCRVKDDGVEKTFRKLTQSALKESRTAAKMIIKLGGQIY
ncbi:spore coat protein [Dethiobacter alkaliphilus]|uniref:spore coat protein n=1 Tax=Dethiobacter alkaliphilus TaxID=427926 RepID=UPI00222791DC|nr:spore coat protein [Dethiobacter alkaliphilus]MCW3489510.1 spore coat protein [Dethiobacter alkaliphilus]